MKSIARFSGSLPEFLSNRCETANGVIGNRRKDGKLVNRKTTRTDERSRGDRKSTDEFST
jgi:hypothetical protein